ncbi:cytochrome b5 [Atractiella rhizophila]|nr:cytochrome b5 [Atractiella rhizophila]
MSEGKVFTFEEVAAHKTKDDLHLLIHGKVYNIAKFLDEHPGGDEVLLGEAGRDATEAFEDVGHSDEARDIMKEYYVGECPEGADNYKKKKETESAAQKLAIQQQSGGGMGYLFPLAILAVYIAWRYYSASQEDKSS